MHWLLFIYKILFSSTCFEHHLQEDTVVYMQHMVLSLSIRFPGGLPILYINYQLDALIIIYS